MAPHERLFVDSDFLEEDKHGKMLSCEKCHGGDPSDNNWKTAHKGVVSDPTYPDPQKTCGMCHPDIAKKNKTSLHISLASYKNKMMLRMNPDKEVQEKVFKAMDTHCMGCHSSCGQCHVSRPKSVGGGLVEGHFFKKTPPVETNCTSCHGSRMEKEYFGKNEGIPPDVHRLKMMKCTDCHKGDEMHGSGKAPFDRYAQENRARCEDCHQELLFSDLKKSVKPLKHPAHAIHRDKVSCQVCHAVAYKNCYNCHVGKDKKGIAYFKTDASVMGFKIGRNPVPTKDRPEEYVTVRHVPIDKGIFDYYVKDALTQFDNLPTWKMATPHTIQLKTPQNKDCVSCHSENNYFLKETDIREGEKEANKNIIASPKCSLDTIHNWLPHADRHLASVECLTCHTGPRKPDKECNQCHSVESILLTRGFVFESECSWKEALTRLEFTNKQVLERRDYIVGCNRIYALDYLGFLLVVIIFGVCLLHGWLRFIIVRRRRESIRR